MSYKSVDELQKALTKDVFGYASSSKKAAGRALGTIVEIITFYLLKSWELSNSISIETRIPEYGNSAITHNVEYSFHPIISQWSIEYPNNGKSLTAYRLLKELAKKINTSKFQRSNNTLLSVHGILRNSCTIAFSNDTYLVASISEFNEKSFVVNITEQSISPYAIFECKRVGVEGGMKKGPQTIEKAKQGAYVARSVSSLQKVRLSTGEIYGIIYIDRKIFNTGPYSNLLEEFINTDDVYLVRDFIYTVGVVSNHGNWFSTEDQNKEMKVLNQSYDRLIFLTDEGITTFVEELLIDAPKEYSNIKKAFLESYGPDKASNQFTKVKMNFLAHWELVNYFNENKEKIERWFNIITPSVKDIKQIKAELYTLRDKKWGMGANL